MGKTDEITSMLDEYTPIWNKETESNKKLPINKFNKIFKVFAPIFTWDTFIKPFYIISLS